MRRFSALLPLLLIWGCSPDKSGTNAVPSEPPTAGNNAPSTAAPEANTASDTNSPAKPEAAPTSTTTKIDPKTNDPAKPPTPDPTPTPPIPAPATDGFKPTPNNAVTTLAEVDAQMKRMRDIELTLMVQAAYPVGRGTAELINRVKGPNDLLLRYANLEPFESNFNLVQYTEVRTAGKSQTLVGKTYVPGHRVPSGNVLETWPKNFSQHLVSNFGDAKTSALSDLAKAAAKAGWTTAVENKKFDNGTYQRVILTSKSKPKRTYSILINPQKKLPVELQMDVDDVKKTRVTTLLRWRQSDRPLTAKDLDPKVETAPHLSGEMGKKPGV